MENDNFVNYQKKYKAKRIEEAKKLKEFLENQGYQCGSRIGKGIPKYTSTHSIAEYDLSNWIWISAVKDDREFIISFNPIDIDNKSGNVHALYDRIGILCTKKIQGLAVKISAITDIDLPLNERSMSEIISIIKQL